MKEFIIKQITITSRNDTSHAGTRVISENTHDDYPSFLSTQCNYLNTKRVNTPLVSYVNKMFEVA